MADKLRRSNPEAFRNIVKRMLEVTASSVQCSAVQCSVLVQFSWEYFTVLCNICVPFPSPLLFSPLWIEVHPALHYYALVHTYSFIDAYSLLLCRREVEGTGHLAMTLWANCRTCSKKWRTKSRGFKSRSPLLCSALLRYKVFYTVLHRTSLLCCASER